MKIFLAILALLALVALTAMIFATGNDKLKMSADRSMVITGLLALTYALSALGLALILSN